MHSRVGVLTIGATVLFVDAVTKHWALTALADGHVVHVAGDLLRLQLTANPGAAFSLGTGITWVFTLLAAAVVFGIIVRAGSLTSRWWIIGLGGLLGGATGNLLDRLLRPPGFGVGHVVDFIALPNFPVFNVADSAIVCSVLVLFLASARGIPMTEPSHG